MNEQLQAALADLLGKANSGIDAGTSFLQAQLPDVIQQFLTWKLISASLTSVVLSLVVIALAIGIKRIFRHGAAQSKDTSERQKASIAYISDFDWFGHGLMIFACSGAASLLGFIGFIKFMTALQILIAPKVYLIEYAASLAK